jgi:hypothetical protein
VKGAVQMSVLAPIFICPPCQIRRIESALLDASPDDPVAN